MQVRRDALGNREITIPEQVPPNTELAPGRKLRVRPPWGGDDTPWTLQILGHDDEIFAGMWVSRSELAELLREVERKDGP